MSDPGVSSGFPQPSAPFVDVNTGRIHQTWLQLLIALWNRTGAGLGIDLAAEEELVGQVIVNQAGIGSSLQAERAASMAQIGALATHVAQAPTVPGLQQLAFMLLGVARAFSSPDPAQPSTPPQISVAPPAPPQWPAITSPITPEEPALPPALAPASPQLNMPPAPLLALKTGPVPPTDITPGLSPYVYLSSFSGMLSIVAGTVSMVEFSRDGGTTFIDLGVTGGIVPMLAGDQVKITYTVAPTLTFIGL